MNIFPRHLFCVVLLGACTGTGEPGVDEQAASGFDALFPKHIDVFGVSVRGTAGTPDDKMLHAANVMAEYLDNDADGVPDNALVVQAMSANNATLIMTIDFAELDDVLSEMGVDDIPEGVLQDQNAAETRPGGAANGVFDASFEEVLHLITHGRLCSCVSRGVRRNPGDFPGQCDGQGSRRAVHADSRSVPRRCLVFTYDDQTCDYGCMAAEYIYWGLTSLLGAQQFPGRLEQIDNEWRLNTPELFEEHDPDLFALLTEPEYALPTRLPTGNYTAGELVFSGDP